MINITNYWYYSCTLMVCIISDSGKIFGRGIHGNVPSITDVQMKTGARRNDCINFGSHAADG